LDGLAPGRLGLGVGDILNHQSSHEDRCAPLGTACHDWKIDSDETGYSVCGADRHSVTTGLAHCSESFDGR